MLRTWPLRRTTAFSNFPRSRFRGFLWSLFLCGVSPRFAMIFFPTSRFASSPSISSSIAATTPGRRAYFASFAARRASRAVSAASYAGSSETNSRESSASYIPLAAAAALWACLRLTPRSYLLRRSCEKRRGGGGGMRAMMRRT